MARTSFADLVVDWEQLSVALVANKADLPHLEALGIELQALLEKARNLSIQQDAQKAVVQQTTKEMMAAIDQGKLLATQLRAGVLSVYGSRSEKLVEFRMKPYRRRTRAAKPEAPARVPPSPQSS